jgi:hypothetical protein
VADIVGKYFFIFADFFLGEKKGEGCEILDFFCMFL